MTLGALPDWFLRDAFLDRLAEPSRDLIRRRPIGLLCEYTAASYGDPHPDYLDPLRSWQEVIEEYVDFAALAAWIDGPRAVHIECIAHFDRSGGARDWTFRHGKYNPSGVMLMDGESGAALTLERESAVQKLHEHLTALPRSGTVLAAAHALLAALEISAWQIRYLLDWVAIEALFGPEDGREITYRMSHRIAHFLGTTRSTARTLSSDVAHGYSWRSKVVHGLRLKKLSPEESLRLTLRAEDILRTALMKMLGGGLMAQFDGKERERYLDSLAFDSLPES